MSEYLHIFCEASIPARRCTSDWYSSCWCVDGVSVKCQQNTRWTVAPSVVPHWMLGMLPLLFGEENVFLRCLGTSPLRGFWTRFPPTRQMRGTRKKNTSECHACGIAVPPHAGASEID
ncbi:surface protease GP63 [Trypanosoma cruzi]|nr:surface protease GP63 [Trypanosoma cruzi]